MFRVLLCATAAVLLGAQQSSPAAAGNASLEYRVKAAFLFNFLKFVEWPPTAGGGPWVIGLLGHDPFGELIDETVRGKELNGRSIEVRRFAHARDAKDCHILFMSGQEFDRLGRHPLAAQPGVLSVGESPGFLQSGGAINFYLEDNRVHFEIRPSVARAVGLRVSSQLLKLGKTL
jgi:hypothetical protein